MTSPSPRKSPLRELHLEPLSAAKFAPFGEIVDRTTDNMRRRHLDSFRFASDAVSPHCWISNIQPVDDQPLVVSHLEAHPQSSQAFVALQPSRFIILVAGTHASSGLPNVDTSRAFLADGTGGIIYQPGVWHASMIVLDAQASFFVAQGLGGAGNDHVVALDPLIDIVDHRGLLKGTKL